MSKLEERTRKLKDTFEMSRLRKYSRDGLRTARATANSSTLTSEPINRPHGYQPINLTDKNIEQSLVQLCGRGPSFVPTPTSIDWNGLQLSWIDFKKKLDGVHGFIHQRKQLMVLNLQLTHSSHRIRNL